MIAARGADVEEGEVVLLAKIDRPAPVRRPSLAIPQAVHTAPMMAMSKVAPGGAEGRHSPPQAEAREAMWFFEKARFFG